MIRPRPAWPAGPPGGRSCRLRPAQGAGPTGWGRVAQQLAQGAHAHRVEGPQRHPHLRQGLQRLGQVGQRRGLLAGDGGGHRVAGLLGREHAVDRQALRVQAQRGQFLGAAAGFGQGAAVGPGHQHHGGQRRVGQGGQGGVEAGLLHLQARVRAQAGGAAVVVLQKAAPGLGQAEQAQGVAGGRGVEHHVVEVLRAAGQQAGELVEGGDLRRAGARELLAHRVAFLGRGLAIWASTRWRYWSAATCGSMFSTDRPGTAGTGTGALRSGTPSISSRLEAASVLTSSTRRPWSASWMAVAVDRRSCPPRPCR
jgi:hypothetical protein